MPRAEDRDALHWLQKRDDGRAYLAHLLVRLLGLSRNEVAAFRKLGGFKTGLFKQFAILRRQGIVTASRVEQARFIGALVTGVSRTGATDKLCPAPLKKWLKYKLRSQEKTWGIAVARQHWPGRSPERELMRGVFVRAASHLVLCKELGDRLLDRDAPRLLSRALVNHLLGAAKEKDFHQAPEPEQKFVRNLCADEQHAQAIECLRYLLATKCAKNERKDVPAKRLKEALADQFRIWRKAAFPTHEYFAKEAVLLISPWFWDQIKSKRGNIKQLAYQLQARLTASPGHTPSIENCKRFLRASAFRSKTT